MGRILGIDLGTTNSLIAVMHEGRPEVIPNLLGARLTPSVVHFSPDGSTIVGEKAVRARATDPVNTVAGIKRFMGRHYNEVIDLIEAVPFQMVAGEDNRAAVRIHGRDRSPEEIASLILADLKASAVAWLGEPVTEAVITVPAHFSHAQRAATRRAGQMAGFDVKRLVIEPTSAAMGYTRGLVDEQNALVIDLGGGTFDVSAIEGGDNVCYALAAAGDTHLGGDDFDEVLLRWVVEELRDTHHLDIRRDPEAVHRVREAVIRAKCELSISTSTRLQIPFLSAGGGAPVHVDLTITREQFEYLADELFCRIEVPIHRVLADAKWRHEQVNRLLLVGGASRMPGVATLVRRIFGDRRLFGLNMEESVALGAAVQAGVLEGIVRDHVLLDSTDATLVVEIGGGGVKKVMARNTTIPTQKKEVFSTSQDDQTSIEVHLLRGEHERAIDNRTLARLKLSGIKPAPRGVARIEVTIDIDATQNISLRARDLESGTTVDVKVD